MLSSASSSSGRFNSSIVSCSFGEVAICGDACGSTVSLPMAGCDGGSRCGMRIVSSRMRGASVVDASGRRTQKTVPGPSARASKPIVPPMPSASRLLIARPRPVPSKRRLRDMSTWLKLAKTRSRAACGMPTPLSITSMSTPSPVGVIRRLTPPRSVNLTALPSRLVRI